MKEISLLTAVVKGVHVLHNDHCLCSHEKPGLWDFHIQLDVPEQNLYNLSYHVHTGIDAYPSQVLHDFFQQLEKIGLKEKLLKHENDYASLIQEVERGYASTPYVDNPKIMQEFNEKMQGLNKKIYELSQTITRAIEGNEVSISYSQWRESGISSYKLQFS